MTGNVGGRVHHFDLRVAQIGAMAERRGSAGDHQRRGQTSSSRSCAGARARWCDGEEPRWCCSSAQGMDVPGSPRSPSPQTTGSERSSTTSTPTGSIRWPPSTPAADHRSSPCPSAGRSRRSPCQPTGRPRPALFHLEPVQAGRVPRRRGGGRRHQPRGSARAPPRGGCLVSSDQDLEAVQRPRLRGQEEPGARALRHRRWQGQTEEGRPSVVICMDEFGPLNLLPRPGKQWAPRIVKGERAPKDHGAGAAGPPTPGPTGSAT